MKQLVLEGTVGADGQREPGRGGSSEEVEAGPSGRAQGALW